MVGSRICGVKLRHARTSFQQHFYCSEKGSLIPWRVRLRNGKEDGDYGFGLRLRSQAGKSIREADEEGHGNWSGFMSALEREEEVQTSQVLTV